MGGRKGLVWFSTIVAIGTILGVGLLAGDLRAASFSVLELMAVTYGVVLGFLLNEGFVRRSEAQARTRDHERHGALRNLLFEAVVTQWTRAHTYWEYVEQMDENEQRSMFDPRTTTAEWVANRDEFLRLENDANHRRAFTVFFDAVERFGTIGRMREELQLRSLQNPSYEPTVGAVFLAMDAAWIDVCMAAKSVAESSGDAAFGRRVEETGGVPSGTPPTVDASSH